MNVDKERDRTRRGPCYHNVSFLFFASFVEPIGGGVQTMITDSSPTKSFSTSSLANKTKQMK